MAVSPVEDTNAYCNLQFIDDDSADSCSSESTGAPPTPPSTRFTSPEYEYFLPLPLSSSSSDLLKIRCCSLPKPTTQMEEAWQRIGDKSSSPEDKEKPSSSTIVFKSTTNIIALRKAQLPRLVGSPVAGMNLSLCTSQTLAESVFNKAYALYCRTVGSHAAARTIARDADRIRKTAVDGKEIVVALRAITASRFKTLWKPKSELTELILGATHMKPFDVYTKRSLLTENPPDAQSEQRSTVRIERRSYHVDDCEEAKGVAILMGSLFAEGLATYKDVVICLETLCASLTEERLEAIFMVISNAGDKICKSTSAETIREMDDLLSQEQEKSYLAKHFRARRYISMIHSVLERYFSLQRNKRERCIKAPGELSRRNRYRKNREVLAMYGLSKVEYTEDGDTGSE